MLTEGGPGWSGRENLYTLDRSRQPLGVECVACRHRSLVPVASVRRQRGVHDMTPVKQLRLRCQCGSREWRATIFRQGDDTAAWQGAPGPQFR